MRGLALVAAVLIGLVYLGDYNDRTTAMRERTQVEQQRADVEACQVAIQQEYDRNTYPYRNQDQTIRWVEPEACR